MHIKCFQKIRKWSSYGTKRHTNMYKLFILDFNVLYVDSSTGEKSSTSDKSCWNAHGIAFLISAIDREKEITRMASPLPSRFLWGLRKEEYPLKNLKNGKSVLSFSGLCLQDTQNQPIRLPIGVVIFPQYWARHCPERSWMITLEGFLLLLGLLSLRESV